ncbi:MAG: YegS/Rv2252/BmrU family lipid kinase [Clostridia bacterium]|nr:YegS/Rv2252/BmrU family lipid kinase [Clostridia bacterium]
MSNPIKALFIVNPFAGKGVSNRQLQKIIRVFEHEEWNVTLYLTTAPNDATYKVIADSEQYDRILCLGGDGTLNEVIRGLVQIDKHIPIGYIPAGSTNDLGFSIGMPKNHVKAAKQIINGCLHDHDVGIFGDDHFVYIASFGAFTKVSWATPQSIKRIFGHSAYVFEGAKALFDIRAYKMRVQTDEGEFQGNYIYGGVSNTFSVGGMYRFSKTEADLSDGLLEVMLVEEPAKAVEIPALLDQLIRHDYNSKYIRFVHTKQAVFTPLDAQYPVWTMDGERKDCEGEATLGCLHQTVQLIY